MNACVNGILRESLFFFSLSHYVLQPCSEEHVNTLSRLIAPRSSRASSFSPIRFCTYPEKAIRTCVHRIRALREDACTSTWCFSPSMSSWREKISSSEKAYATVVSLSPLSLSTGWTLNLAAGRQPFQRLGFPHGRIIRIGLRTANVESRRPVRLILRRRGNGDVSTFSLTCVSRDQGRTSSLSLASINRKNRFTQTLPRRYIAVRIRGFFPYAFYYGERW